MNIKMLEKIRTVVGTPYHDQGSWRRRKQVRITMPSPLPVRDCNTVMCIAGWACELDKGTWAFPADHGFSEYLLATPEEVDMHLACRASDVIGEGQLRASPNPVDPGTWLIATRDRAQAVLQLDHADANKLFDGDTTPRRVLAIIDALIAREKAEKVLAK